MKELVHSTSIEWKLRSISDDFEKLFKAERVIIKAKMVIIKEIENKIVSLWVDLTYTSSSKTVLHRNDIVIAHIRK